MARSAGKNVRAYDKNAVGTGQAVQESEVAAMPQIDSHGVLDLESVRLFSEVVRLGSFSRAAEELYLSKSMIKKRVDELEAHVGVRLLERSTKGVRLTAAGSVFAQRMHSVFAEIDETCRACREVSRGSVRRTIRIAYYSDFTFPMIQYCCDNYASLHPEDKVVPVFTKFNNAFEMVRSGAVDLAICAKPSAVDAAGLLCTTLFTTRMGGMVLAGSDLAEKDSLSREDLAAHEVVIHPMWCTREDLDAWCKRPPSFSVRFDEGSSDAMQNTCVRGGIYLYPESDAFLFPAYRFLPLDDPISSYSTAVCPLSPAPGVTDFVEATVAYIVSHTDATTMRLLEDWSERPPVVG